MALVKKLEPGGTVDPNLLNDALNEELGSYNLRSKDERKVRDALTRLRDFSATSGNSFTSDPVAQKFIISGQGSDKFVGSPDDVKSNWFTGNLKINDDQDAMSVAAAIYAGANKRIQGTTSTQTTPTAKTKINIGNYDDYFVDDIYGGKEAFRTDFNKLKTDDERKSKYLSGVGQYLSEYESGVGKNTDDYEYADLDKIAALKTALGDGSLGNWDKVVEAAHKLHWNPNHILLNAEDKATITNEENAAKATQTIADLQTKGLNPNISTPYINAGYSYADQLSPVGFSPEQVEAFNTFITEKKGFRFQDANGRQFAIDATGKPIQSTGAEFNQFNPLTGKAWGGDASTGFTYGEGKYMASAEDNDAIDKGKGLDIPQFKGQWVTTGFSRKGQDEEHSLLNGNRDYTKYIELTNPYKGKLTLTKDAEGNYTDDKGTAYGKLKISGYNPTSNTEINQWKMPTEFSNINPSYEYLNPSLRDPKIVEVFGILENPSIEIDANTKNTMRELVGSLKQIISTTQDHELKVKSLKTLSALNEKLKEQQIVLKEGGVLKAQEGNKLDAYLTKYAKPSKQSGIQSTVPTKSRDISGLVRGSTGLDKTILAANLGMLAPGAAGVAAGLVGTGLEAYRDATDENGWTWGDTGNLALNLGLTAASFVGMGFLKGVTKGTKAAVEATKALDMAGDTSKVLKGVAESAKGTGNVTQVSNAIKGINEFAAGKSIKNLGELATLAKEDKAVMGHLSVLTGFSEGLAKNPNIISSLSNITSLATVGKTAKTVGTGVALVGGAMNLGGATDALKKVYNGNISDLSLEDVNSLASVAFAAKIAGTHAKMKIGKKYGLQATENTPARVEATIGKERVILNDANLIKDKKVDVPFLNRNKELKQKFVDEHNKKIDTQIAATKDADAIKELQKSKATIKDVGKIDVIKETNSGFKVKEGVDYISDQNRDLQRLGIRWANRYGMAPNAGRVATSTWGKTKETLFGTPTKPVAEAVKEQAAVAKEMKQLGPHVPIKPKAKAVKKPLQLKASEFAKKANPKPIVMAEGKNGVYYVPEKQSLQLPGKKQIQIPELTKTKNERVFELSAGKTPKKAPKKAPKKTPKKLQGGILKYQNASEVPMGPLNRPIWKKGYTNTLDNSGVDYQKGLLMKGQNTFSVPSQAKTGNSYYGGVTNELIQKNWDPEILKSAGLDPTDVSKWPANASELLQKHVESRPELFSQLKDQTSPSHDKFGMDWYYTGIKNPSNRVPDMVPMESKPMALETKPVVALTPTGTSINAGVSQTPGAINTIWDKMKGGLDSTSIANGLMALNTYGANAWIGDEQRKAISAGLYQLPYMPHQYLRVDKPYSLEANKQAAEVNSQGKRMAASTSDLNQGAAMRFQGLKQANDIITKGQGLDQERMDKIRGMQIESNAGVDSYNTQTLGKNRGLTGEAMQKIHLVNANQRNAQNTVTNNWLTAWDKNYGLNQYKQNMAKYFDMTNDPQLKSLSDEYTDFAGEKGQANTKALYEANKANYDKTALHSGTPYPTFENSKEYKTWQEQSGKKLDFLKTQMKPMEKAQQQLNLDQQMLYFKKGGGLTKEQKIDIDNAKFNNIKRLKETELTYKAIMHNNEMLQKALIKVFK